MKNVILRDIKIKRKIKKISSTRKNEARNKSNCKCQDHKYHEYNQNIVVW